MCTVEEMISLKKKYGLSYEYISQESEVPISTVQKVLGGINKNPRKNTIEALSKFFDKYKNLGLIYRAYDSGDDDYFRETGYYYSKGRSALKSEDGSFSGKIYTQSGYTYDDYCKLELPEGTRVEIIDGVIYEISAPSVIHQLIIGEMHIQFYTFIKKNKGKCVVLFAPVDVRLEYDKGDMTVVQPDFLVVCDKDKFSDNRSVQGAPDFVMEVTSPSTRRRDLNLKRQKYKEDGVREYWIADPESRTVIKTVFEGEEKTTIHSFEDDIPVYIYDGKLVLTLRDVDI